MGVLAILDNQLNYKVEKNQQKIYIFKDIIFKSFNS